MLGYRNWVVHIHHTDRWGGLNLNMKSKVVIPLNVRRARASERLLRASRVGTRRANSLGSYAMSDDQRTFARAATRQIISTLNGWESQSRTFRDRNIQHPEPELRVRPNI